MKPFSFSLLLCLLMCFIINIEPRFSLNECECKSISNKEKLIIQMKNDSLEVYKYIKNLRESNSEACLLESLQLEFDFLLRSEKTELLLELIDVQVEIIERLRCSDALNFNIYYNKAVYYRANNNFEKLSEFAFLALKEAERLNDIDKEIQIIKEIVFLFTRMKENEKRWLYVKQAEKLILASKDDFKFVTNHRWLAYEYENQYTKTERKTLLDSTLLFINRSKQGALKNNMYYELALIYRGLEACSYHQRELKQALVFIDSAIYYGKKTNAIKNLSGMYLSKAWDHLDLNEFEKADKWMDSALSYDNKSDLVGHMMMLSEASQIYEGSGELKKAYNSFKDFSKIKDSIISKERIEVVNELETKYKTELKDSQIKRLIILLIVAFAFIIFILFLGSIIRLKRTRQKNEALKLAFDKQITLEKELTSVRDNIAQDFHDDLGNQLARISLLSNLVNKEVSKEDTKLRSKVKQITDDANSLYLGTRDFIFSLKTNSNHIEEVATYLSDFGEDFFSKTPIRFILKKNISKNQKLPYYWSKQLVFIFKEAMTNALKYSKCTTVFLKFEFKNNELCIECIDNGIGINDIDLKSSNGILNMKKRAKRINGQLNIETEVNNGCTVKFLGRTDQNQNSENEA